MTRTSLVICLAASMAATVGCTSKNYVKQQNHAVDQQDQRTRRPDREEFQGHQGSLTPGCNPDWPP